jgi:hypothetical protein
VPQWSEIRSLRSGFTQAPLPKPRESAGISRTVVGFNRKAQSTHDCVAERIEVELSVRFGEYVANLDRGTCQQRETGAPAPHRPEIRSLRSGCTETPLPKPRETAGISRAVAGPNGNAQATHDCVAERIEVELSVRFGESVANLDRGTCQQRETRAAAPQWPEIRSLRSGSNQAPQPKPRESAGNSRLVARPNKRAQTTHDCVTREQSWANAPLRSKT